MRRRACARRAPGPGSRAAPDRGAHAEGGAFGRRSPSPPGSLKTARAPAGSNTTRRAQARRLAPGISPRRQPAARGNGDLAGAGPGPLGPRGRRRPRRETRGFQRAGPAPPCGGRAPAERAEDVIIVGMRGRSASPDAEPRGPNGPGPETGDVSGPWDASPPCRCLVGPRAPWDAREGDRIPLTGARGSLGIRALTGGCGELIEDLEERRAVPHPGRLQVPGLPSRGSRNDQGMRRGQRPADVRRLSGEGRHLEAHPGVRRGRGPLVVAPAPRRSAACRALASLKSLRRAASALSCPTGLGS